MKQVVVYQVPAPALVVAAQQGHVSLALHRCPLCSNADHSHSAKRAFPPDLPGMSSFWKANLATCTVGALGDGVAVQGEAVLLHVNITGAVMGTQGKLKSLELWETWTFLSFYNYGWIWWWILNMWQSSANIHKTKTRSGTVTGYGFSIIKDSVLLLRAL